MTSPDLSGILNQATKVTSTTTSNKTSKTVTTQKPLFEIDDYGNIDVKTLKGSSFYNLAKACDKNNDNKLQLAEIAEFLNNESIKNNDVDTGYYRTVYYQEKNSDGEITKRAYYGKGDNAQYVFSYSNGKAVKCNILMPDGKTYNYDLKNGKVKIGSKNSKKTSQMTIAGKIRNNYEQIGNSVYNEKAEKSILHRILDIISKK